MSAQLAALKQHVVASMWDELRARQTERESQQAATETALKRELEVKRAETDSLKEQVRVYDLERVLSMATWHWCSFANSTPLSLSSTTDPYYPTYPLTVSPPH